MQVNVGEGTPRPTDFLIYRLIVGWEFLPYEAQSYNVFVNRVYIITDRTILLEINL